MIALRKLIISQEGMYCVLLAPKPLKMGGYKLDHSVSWALFTRLLEVNRPKLIVAKNTSIKKVT